VVEPLWLLTGQPVALLALDAAGTASLAVPVPNQPTLRHLPVWCQAVPGVAFPLRASTLAGGVID
jgi:hypothetical protein